MMKYQAGGPVKNPPSPGAKLPNVEGGRKARLRDLISPEERRELDAPLTAEEVRRMSERMKKGGAVKMKSGGVTRGDGCATRGKTKGRMV
jgi:hypothetical protein